MKPAVLLMAHGTPNRVAEMEEYLTHIAGRRPPADLVREMQRRYLTFGGRSPLTEICMKLAAALEERLDGIPVRVGMRHWKPFIRDVVRDLPGSPLVGLPLAPHYSRAGVARYHAALQAAAPDRPVRAVRSWHLQPRLVQLWQERIRKRLAPETTILFTAHSVPEEHGDPYPVQVRETADAIMRGLDVRWELAYQSRGRARVPWLGPDVLEKLPALGAKRILVAPIGFLCDHAEILYDLDVQLRRAAEERGIRYARCEMPNTDPRLVDALEEIVRETL